MTSSIEDERAKLVSNGGGGVGLLPALCKPTRSEVGSCSGVPFNESFAKTNLQKDTPAFFHDSREPSELGEPPHAKPQGHQEGLQSGESYAGDDDARDKPQLVSLSSLVQQITEMQNSSYEHFHQGDNLNSISQVEKVVAMRRFVEGPQSAALIGYIAETGCLFNSEAMEILEQGNSEEALQILLATQSILSQGDPQNSKICSLYALTLKNLSSVYKRIGEISEAQECLQKLLQDTNGTEAASFQQNETSRQQDTFAAVLREEGDVQNKLEPEDNALLHLNLCAIFSSKTNHERAKTHAHLAIQDLKQDIAKLSQAVQQADSYGESEVEALNGKIFSKVSLLTVAYFNLACEFEHLGQLYESIQAYRRAKELNVGPHKQPNIESQIRQAMRQIKLYLKDAGNYAQNPRHPSPMQSIHTNTQGRNPKNNTVQGFTIPNPFACSTKQRNQSNHRRSKRSLSKKPSLPMPGKMQRTSSHRQSNSDCQQQVSRKPLKSKHNDRGNETVSITLNCGDSANSGREGSNRNTQNKLLFNLSASQQTLGVSEKMTPGGKKNAEIAHNIQHDHLDFRGQDANPAANRRQSPNDRFLIDFYAQQNKQRLSASQYSVDRNLHQMPKDPSLWQDSALKSAPEGLAGQKQQSTPVKEKNFQTMKSSLANKRNATNIDPEGSEHKGLMWNYNKRPSSAHNIKKQLFSSQVPRQQVQKPDSSSSAAPLRLKKQASHCLKHVNWTNQWLSKAFISVENSDQFAKTFHTSNHTQKTLMQMSIAENSELERSASSISVPKYSVKVTTQDSPIPQQPRLNCANVSTRPLQVHKQSHNKFRNASGSQSNEHPEVNLKHPSSISINIRPSAAIHLQGPLLKHQP